MDTFAKLALLTIGGGYPSHSEVGEVTWDSFWAWSLDFWAVWSLWQDISLWCYNIQRMDPGINLNKRMNPKNWSVQLAGGRETCVCVTLARLP